MIVDFGEADHAAIGLSAGRRGDATVVPERVALPVVLASGRASSIREALSPVDGGWTAIAADLKGGAGRVP